MKNKSAKPFTGPMDKIIRTETKIDKNHWCTVESTYKRSWYAEIHRTNENGEFSKLVHREEFPITQHTESEAHAITALLRDAHQGIIYR